MFRAPYGVWPPALFSYCARAGLTPLARSVDPRDWSRPRRVRDRPRHRGRHPHRVDHLEAQRRRQTVAALKIGLPRLLGAGYQFTTP